MAARKLVTALAVFSRCLRDARDLADDAYKWSIPTGPGAVIQISPQRRDALTEMAFLRAFTGWEAFLEETFLLYLLGHRSPKGQPPRRYGFPPNGEAACEWCAEGRDYAKWGVNDVRRRADWWFRHGKPFAPALQARQFRLDQLATIRNAIAHESLAARTKFENLVREELKALPRNTTVGSFLIATKPNSKPPISFMEFYLNEVRQVADNIVPR